MDKQEIRRALAGPVPSIRVPFDREGNIDFRGLRNLVDRCLAAADTVEMATTGEYLDDPVHVLESVAAPRKDLQAPAVPVQVCRHPIVDDLVAAIQEERGGNTVADILDRIGVRGRRVRRPHGRGRRSGTRRRPTGPRGR